MNNVCDIALECRVSVTMAEDPMKVQWLLRMSHYREGLLERNLVLELKQRSIQ